MTNDFSGDLPRARESRVVDHESVVTVDNDDGPHAVRVKLDGVTLVGSLPDVQRLIIDADKLLARLTRPPKRRPTG